MRANVLMAAVLLMAGSIPAVAFESTSKNAVATPAASLAADYGPAATDAEGDALVSEIVGRFGGVMREMHGWNSESFERLAGYRNYPLAVLKRALASDSYEAMLETLTTFDVRRAQAGMAKAFPVAKGYDMGATRPGEEGIEVLAEARRTATKALGDVAKDLVFVPIAPCTVWDTRYATTAAAAGIIGPGVTRSFWAYNLGAGTSFSTMGGNPNCAEANQTFIGGMPYAVMMIVYVNNPAGNGWLTFYRYNDPDPSNATISVYYSAGPTRTQTVIAKVYSGAYDVSATSRYSSAHASASVVGYFIRPQATALDCTTVASASAAIAAGGSTFTEASCAVGYSVTGGACENSSTGGLEIDTFIPGNGYRCWAKNVSAGSLNLTAHARCCRVPGRP